MANTAEIILKVNNLTTVFRSKSGSLKAVDDVSFSLRQGEIFGLVGESGSGKSATCRSIIGLIKDPPGRIVSGSVMYGEKNLLTLPESKMRYIRGAQISMIFQDPMTALNPVMRVGRQIMETFLEHTRISNKEAKSKAIELLKLVGVPAAEDRFNDYPHNFSGGMRQRVLIAMALALRPRILLADEPTTALDVTIQDQILKLILSLQMQFNLSVIMVSHNLGVITQTCGRLAVMYAGQILEIGTTKSLFKNPRHPYTQALLESIPGEGKKSARLKSIKGSPPFLASPPSGCRFHPRCPFVEEDCKHTTYHLREVLDSQFSACIKDRFN